ncbi:MAG TPA: serine/threonine-protein kinase [Ktedonobacteraceae bacterium]
MLKRTSQLRSAPLMRKRYRIIRQCGSGGSGVIYQAKDTLLDLPVAIKSFTGEAHTTQQARHEARLLAQLKQHRIPSFIDYFEVNCRWYLVMQWVEGTSLKSNRPNSIQWVVRIGQQLCDILSYLHHCRPPIIHRDIKPSNLLLTAQRRLYLIDFGVSCAPGFPEYIAGSQGYAAPEQWDSEQPLTPSADIYACGMVLRQVWTGLDPSQAVSVSGWVNTVPRNIPREQPGFQALADLLKRMVSPDINERPDIERVWQELAWIDETLHNTGADDRHTSEFPLFPVRPAHTTQLYGC